MAWPPTPLPINFQNATVSLDTHPQAHNNTNIQINNDIVPQIQILTTNRFTGIAQFTLQAGSITPSQPADRSGFVELGPVPYPSIAAINYQVSVGASAEFQLTAKALINATTVVALPRYVTAADGFTTITILKNVVLPANSPVSLEIIIEATITSGSIDWFLDPLNHYGTVLRYQTA